MRKYLIFALVIITTFWGCSKRDNPAGPTVHEGKIVTGFVNSSSLEASALELAAGRDVCIYEPPGYSVSHADSFELYIEETRWTSGDDSVHFDTTHIVYRVNDTDYPSLYLLHDFWAIENYYVDVYMLKDLLDEMIATCEIEPMVVITPDCSNYFGGSFYTNSPEILTGSGLSFSGRFEDFVTQDLIDYIGLNFNVDTTAASRGISGHAMGGYGAIRLAMNHPELYGSVSSMSAPLDFSQFDTLFDMMLAEAGYTPNDTAAFYALWPSGDTKLLAMGFAMGSAFSPHEGLDSDTTFFHRVAVVPGVYFGIDLPFGIDGQLATGSAVWQRWLGNDPLTMLNGGGYTALQGKPIYLDWGNADDYGFGAQNQAFVAALNDYGLTVTAIEYGGYAGHDAGHSTFIRDRLREVLKFHSEAFLSR